MWSSMDKVVRFSELAGKSILVFIESWPVNGDTEYLGMLKDKYSKKGKGDDFEVIHFYDAIDKASYDELVTCLPWLVYAHSDEVSKLHRIRSGISKLGAYGNSALVAFGGNRKLVALESGCKFQGGFSLH